MKPQNMINAVSIWYVYYMYVIFVIWQCPDIYEIAKNAFPKMYQNIKMSVFEAQYENILAGFISKHDKIYVIWITQHQI